MDTPWELGEIMGVRPEAIRRALSIYRRYTGRGVGAVPSPPPLAQMGQIHVVTNALMGRLAGW